MSAGWKPATAVVASAARMRGLWRRYRWYAVAALVAYGLATLWLWMATRGDQIEPFRYQVF